MEKKSGSGLNIPDHFSESLDRYLLFLGLKILKFFDAIRIRDLESFEPCIRDLGWKYSDPG